MGLGNLPSRKRSSSRVGRASTTSTQSRPDTTTELSRGVKRSAPSTSTPVKRRRAYVSKFPGLTTSPYFTKPETAPEDQSQGRYGDAITSDDSELSEMEATPEPPEMLSRSLDAITSRIGGKESLASPKDSAVESSVESLLVSEDGDGQEGQESEDAGSTIAVTRWQHASARQDQPDEAPTESAAAATPPQSQLSDVPLQPATDDSQSWSDEDKRYPNNAPEMTTEQLEQFQIFAPDGLRRSRRPSRLVDYATLEPSNPAFDAGQDELANSPVDSVQNGEQATRGKAAPAKRRVKTPMDGKSRRLSKKNLDGARTGLVVKLKFMQLAAPSALTEVPQPQQEQQQKVQTSPTDLSAFRYQPSPAAKSPPKPRTPLKKIWVPQASPSSVSESLNDDEHLLRDINPELIALAKRLMHRDPLGSKPKPSSKPLVWADTRQALTETLSYFKRPQGGCYSKDGHIYGFLLDGVSHSREYMSADVVISRQGGGMGPDGKTFAQAKDHHISDAQATSFQNNIGNQNPIVLIVGQRNTAMHIAVPRTFCVLDFYKPIAVWTEKTQGTGKKVRCTVKYRFERLRGDGMVPWHAVKDSTDDPSHHALAGPLSRASCTSCHHAYPQIYLCGWMCLNGDCMNFWKLADGRDAPTGKMLYNPAFLLDRTPWPRELPSWPLRPALPDFGKVIGDNLLYVNSRGLCCPRCGRCTQRYKFSGWVCDNVECDFPGVSPNWSILEAPQLHRPWDIISDGIPHTRNKHRADRGASMSVEYSGDWKISRYRFEGVNGQLLHVSPTRRLNARSGGADDMLAELQRASFTEENTFSLERRRFKGNKGSGKAVEQKTPQKTPQKSARKRSPLPAKSDSNDSEEDAADPEVADDDELAEDGDFMGAFSINYGWPYKFIATGASESFDDAPEAIRASRSMLEWAAKEFLGSAADGHDDFNEQLVFTYMEDQKLGYHDDGEQGLGPRIGTMTLGGPAQMNIRLKMKYFAGCSKETKIFTYERPLPKCYYAHDKDKSGWYQHAYEQRVAGFEELEKLKTDPQRFKIRSREIPQEIGMHPHCRRHADDIINLTLRHGDMVFMEGYDIQKYFEHGVQAEGFLRYALTCRKVLPGHLELKDHPKYEVRADDYGYVGPVFDD